ncbi:hypothetical protein [Kangiella sp.]|uniref:hypothetical protein n=1 Tax=Kangiella sp. TaxID=1920245 RepID=UPI003A94C831
MNIFKVSIVVALAAFQLVACDQNDESEKVVADHSSTLATDYQEQAKDEVITDKDDGVIEVTTTDYKISAPSAINKGWTTFRFKNEGKQVHFVAMYRLVDGKNIDDQLAEVAPVFDPLMEGLRNGELTKADIGPFFAENVPEWGLQMTWVGGAALLSPGKSTESSFYIEKPGIYLVECYVKAPNGQWHTLMGMMHQIEVSDDLNDAIEPTSDYQVIVSNSGVEAPSSLPAGEHTIKISMQDNPASFIPYDLNLARLSDDTDLEEVYFWMDWTNVGGLRAPAPVQFIGGLEHMSEGNHGYIKVDLTPGRYLWVSEINAAEINKSFVVE